PDFGKEARREGVAKCGVDRIAGRSCQTIVAVYGIIIEAELLERVSETSAELMRELSRYAKLNTEMRRLVGIDGTERDAGLIAQVQQLIVDPRVVGHGIPRETSVMAAPTGFDCRCRLGIEIRSRKGCGRKCRVGRLGPARRAVRRAIDRGEQVIVCG